MRRKSSQGGARLEYHKSEESCMTVQNKTVVDLKSMIKIEPFKSNSRKVSFRLTFDDTFIVLSTENDMVMKEWVKMIKRLVLPPDPIYQPRLTAEAGIIVFCLCLCLCFFYKSFPYNKSLLSWVLKLKNLNSLIVAKLENIQLSRCQFPLFLDISRVRGISSQTSDSFRCCCCSSSPKNWIRGPCLNVCVII